MEENNYTGSNIKVLKGLEAVKKRPGMYIGDTGVDGLHHMVWEVFDNSLDEAVAGYGETIQITLEKDHSITVSDNGRGIPVDIHPTEKIPTATVVLTVLHAGGKFDEDAYKTSGGLHGVGASVVNALSSKLELTIQRNSTTYTQTFEKGVPVTELIDTGKKSKQTGTTIHFIPDNTIFSHLEYEVDRLRERIKTISFLNKGLSIMFIDKVNNTEETFHSEKGMLDFVYNEFSEEQLLTKPVNFYGTEDNIAIDFVFAYERAFTNVSHSFANNVKTDSGTHEVGASTAFSRAVLDKIKNDKSANKKDTDKITSDDIKEGLFTVISVKVSDPEFGGQTKGKLNNPEVRPAVYKLIKEKTDRWIEENPKVFKEIIKKILLAKKAREASKRSREMVRKDVLSPVSVLPGKLSDCHSNKPEECELFLVEGESASGCFLGETMIKLSSGVSDTIYNISKRFKNGEEIYIYTYNHNSLKIELQKISNCWETKKVKNLVKVTLDNEKEIICTPEHLFMLRDGSYIEANKLKESMSLMPLYTGYSVKKENGHGLNGYEYVIQQDGSSEYTHFLADEYNSRNKLGFPLNKRYVRHHIDFNKKNNNPNNLIRMSWDDHRKLHNDMCHLNFHTPEANEKTKRTMATPESKAKRKKIVEDLWRDPSYREKYAKDHHKKMRANQLARGINNGFGEYWSNNENKLKQSARVTNYYEEHPEKKLDLSLLAKKQWENEDLLEWRREKTKEQMNNKENVLKKLDSEYRTRIRNSVVLLNSVGIDNYEKFRTKKEYRIHTLLEKIELTGVYDFKTIQDLLKSDVYTYNHKVLTVESLFFEEEIGVYDIEVPETHNFALDAGIFVHNSSKMGRDSNVQAILALKGKILNVFKETLDRAKNSDEISNISAAIGLSIGGQVNYSKLRYHKIIIMTDADVDGDHIGFLCIMLFYKYFPDLIKKGHVYVVEPPLFRVKKNTGNESYYFQDEKFLLKKFPTEESLKNWTRSRFKGLGEMNPEQLWETTMDPKNRNLVQLRYDEGQDLSANTILSLLGGKDGDFRQWFLFNFKNYDTI